MIIHAFTPRPTQRDVAALSGQNLERGQQSLTKYLGRAAADREPSLANAHWRLGMGIQQQRQAQSALLQLQRAIKDFIDATNETPKPFVRTKTADAILASIARFAQTSTPGVNRTKSPSALAADGLTVPVWVG